MQNISFALLIGACAGIVVLCWWHEQRQRDLLTYESDAEGEYNELMRRVKACEDSFTYWELMTDIKHYENKYRDLIGVGLLFQYTGRLSRKMKDKDYLRML